MQKNFYKAFCPAHITGFFAPEFRNGMIGSIGAGITLNVGVTAHVSDGEPGIFFNEQPTEIGPVKTIIKRLNFSGRIELKSHLPLGCGFGLSGAASLASALTINQALHMGNDVLTLADMAHISEITCKTGLGDVVAQMYGGMVVRERGGKPSEAVVRKFTISSPIDIVILGRLPTEEILSDNTLMERIAIEGRQKLRAFLKFPTLSNFFFQSREFAVDTGLADSSILDIIEAVESQGGLASMAMLGKVVFAINGFDALNEFGEVIQTRIDDCGARLM